MASSDPQSARRRRAASGHARLGYAGGSRRSSESFEIGDPELARVLDRQSFARNFEKARNCYGRNNANHKRHIPTWLLDVLRKRARVVIYRVSMDSAIGMSVTNEVAVSPARMIKSKAEVIVTGVSGRGFRCSNADALERKGQRRRHHDDDSDPSKERSPCEVQRSGSSMVTRLSYTRAGIGGTRAPAPRCRQHTMCPGYVAHDLSGS